MRICATLRRLRYCAHAGSCVRSATLVTGLERLRSTATDCCPITTCNRSHLSQDPTRGSRFGTLLSLSTYLLTLPHVLFSHAASLGDAMHSYPSLIHLEASLICQLAVKIGLVLSCLIRLETIASSDPCCVQATPSLFVLNLLKIQLHHLFKLKIQVGISR